MCCFSTHQLLCTVHAIHSLGSCGSRFIRALFTAYMQKYPFLAILLLLILNIKASKFRVIYCMLHMFLYMYTYICVYTLSTSCIMVVDVY